MEVRLGLWIGEGRHREWAWKCIDLDLTPMVGMTYLDETWKGTKGRDIIAVQIVHPPEEVREETYLSVTLAPDESDAAQRLAEMVYHPNDWDIH